MKTLKATLYNTSKDTLEGIKILINQEAAQTMTMDIRKELKTNHQ